MRFRDHHQAPEGTDLEYVTRINGFKTEQEFIEAHHGSPYYVSMVGFVPGLPWCFQMVGPERQLEVPKYLTPRTDTPALALSHGGAFAAIYPVQGPGGYQLFAMCPVPIFDPKEELPDFQDSFVIFRVGDILKIRPDRPRRLRRHPRRGRGEDLPLQDGRRGVRAAGVLRRSRGLQRRARAEAVRVIRVHDGGVRTTVQDAGRFGLYHFGMPPSGALDDYSFRAANLLVGNDEGAAVLEATFSGPTLEFEQDAVIAVTGADLPLKLDGEEQPGWTSLAVKAGQVLSFDFLRAGARAYIAVAGGIDVPVVFGSRSTYALCVIGGLEGRAIREGDVAARRRCASGCGRAHGRGAAPPGAAEGGRAARQHGPLRLPPHRGGAPLVPRERVDGHARGRPHRLPLPRRPALVRRARAAVRSRQRPVERGRRRLPGRLDPGAGRRRADLPAQRRRHRRRLRHDRHGHQRRPRCRSRSRRPTARPTSAQSASRRRCRPAPSGVPASTPCAPPFPSQRSSTMAERTVRSPLPGTFYRRPSPEAEPFVKEGDAVATGDVIGLVEVMKTYYELKADQDGVADRFLIEDAGSGRCRRRRARPARRLRRGSVRRARMGSDPDRHGRGARARQAGGVHDRGLTPVPVQTRPRRATGVRGSRLASASRTAARRRPRA